MIQGSKAFYDITTEIKEYLLADEFINTVSFGAIERINVNKLTNFPLAHLQVGSADLEEQRIVLNISILFIDILNQSKDDSLDTFVRNNNEQDIFNTQLYVANRLVQRLRNGILLKYGYELDGTPAVNSFTERFENELAGWQLDLSIALPNNISVC